MGTRVQHLNLVFGLWSKYLMELDYVTYYFG